MTKQEKLRLYQRCRTDATSHMILVYGWVEMTISDKKLEKYIRRKTKELFKYRLNPTMKGVMPYIKEIDLEKQREVGMKSAIDYFFPRMKDAKSNEERRDIVTQEINKFSVLLFKKGKEWQRNQQLPKAKHWKSVLKHGWNRMVGWCIQFIRHLQFREP